MDFDCREPASAKSNMSVPLKKRHCAWKHIFHKSGVGPLLLGQSGRGEEIDNSVKYNRPLKHHNGLPHRAVREFQTLDSSELNSLRFTEHHISEAKRDHWNFQFRHSQISEGDLCHMIAASDGQLSREARQQEEMLGRRRLTKSWVDQNTKSSASSQVEHSGTEGALDEIYLHINGRKYIARPVETQEIRDDGSSTMAANNSDSSILQECLESSTHNRSAKHLPISFDTSNTQSFPSDTLSGSAKPLSHSATKESESLEQIIMKDKLSVLSQLKQVQDATPLSIMVGSDDSSGDEVWEYQESSTSENIIVKQPYVEKSSGSPSYSSHVAPHTFPVSQSYGTQKLHSLALSHSRNIQGSREDLLYSNQIFTSETQGAVDDSVPGCSGIPPNPSQHSLPMSPGSVDTPLPNSMRSVSHSDPDSPEISTSNSDESDRHIVPQPSLSSEHGNCIVNVKSPYTTLTSHAALTVDTSLKTEENDIELPTVMRPKDNKCPVCDDEISGYHYGIYSCESCKGFFKRTVQSRRNERGLRCARSGNCEMNLRSRKHCAACRFQKCLNQGMKLEAIRRDRQRGGRSMYEGSSEYRRRLMIRNQQEKNPPKPNVKKRKRRQSACGGVKKAETWESQIGMKPVSQGNVTSGNVMNSTQYHESNLLEDLVACNEVLSTQPVASCCQLRGHSEEAIVHSVCHLINHHLVVLYEWTQGLPFFRELETVDQEFLYKSRWIHLMLSHYVLTSPTDPAMITLRDGSVIDLEQHFESAAFSELIKRLGEIYRYFRSLCLDSKECALLKLLVLLNSDLPGISQPSRVGHFQETVQDMLFQYVLSKDSTNYRRVGDIMLKFAEIEKMCLCIYEHIMYKFMAGHFSEFGHLSEVLKTPDLTNT